VDGVSHSSEQDQEISALQRDLSSSNLQSEQQAGERYEDSSRAEKVKSQKIESRGAQRRLIFMQNASEL
jgi:hypothetical protein